MFPELELPREPGLVITLAVRVEHLPGIRHGLDGGLAYFFFRRFERRTKRAELRQGVGFP